MIVNLNDVRITFCNQLFEPKQVNGQGEAKYSSAFLFAKNHSAVNALAGAIQKVAQEKWGVKAEDVLKQLKASDKLCVHDGDAKSTYEGYAGNLFINASNKTRPIVINHDMSTLTAADGKPYSGAYVNTQLDIWAQDNQFGKRINATLMVVQFARNGDRLAGGSSADLSAFQAIPQADAAAAEKTGAASLF